MKRNRRAFVLGIFGVLLLSAGVYLWGPSKTPPAQQPLSILSVASFSEFGAAFDSASDGPRLVLLLSPT
jgi:hypothetical protein